MGCSTLQAVLAARIQQHPYIDASSKAPCYISHFVLAERLYNCAARSRWQQHSYIDAAFLGCSTLQAVLAARFWQRHPYVYAGSEARLVHLSIPACWLLVLAAAPIHPCSIIGLQHSSSRAGCSYWQRHSYIDATLLGYSTLQAVLAARSGSSTHTSMRHYWAACSTLQVVLAAMLIQARTTSALVHWCSIIGLQHSSSRACCSYSAAPMH